MDINLIEIKDFYRINLNELTKEMKKLGFAKWRQGYYMREEKSIFQIIGIYITFHRDIEFIMYCVPVFYPHHHVSFGTIKVPVAIKMIRAVGEIAYPHKYYISEQQKTEWEKAINILINQWIPSLNDIPKLNELCKRRHNDHTFLQKEGNIWGGVSCCVNGILNCLDGNYDEGIRLFESAYDKYMLIAKQEGLKIEIGRDELSSVYKVIELFYLEFANNDNIRNNEKFSKIYNEICNISRIKLKIIK